MRFARELLRCNSVDAGWIRSGHGSIMRMYSPEELDVMAEAYERALDKLPSDLSSIEITQRLVQEIGWGVANGIRDEDELAATALERTNMPI